jgi:hypothetical protein
MSLVDPQGLSPELIIGNGAGHPSGSNPIGSFVVDELGNLRYKELVFNDELYQDTYLFAGPIWLIAAIALTGRGPLGQVIVE